MWVELEILKSFRGANVEKGEVWETLFDGGNFKINGNTFLFTGTRKRAPIAGEEFNVERALSGGKLKVRVLRAFDADSTVVGTLRSFPRSNGTIYLTYGKDGRYRVTREIGNVEATIWASRPMMVPNTPEGTAAFHAAVAAYEAKIYQE